MSLRSILAAPAAAAATAVGVWVTLRRWPDAPRRVNVRGKELPVVLGLAVGLGITAGALVANHGRPVSDLVITANVVLLAGLLDDLRGSAAGSARGIRGHLRALLRGQLTTGILKILVGFGAAYYAVSRLGGGVGRQVLGVFVIAGCTNLWNVLDVAPGRAVKFFVPVQAWTLAAIGPDAPLGGFVAWGLLSALVVLPFDLRERAMLGDAGSNALGYLAGVGLYLTLDTPALGIVLVLILGLQFIAETLTLSRAIAATPPLRWYDRLGRLAPDPPATASGAPDPRNSR